MNQCKTIRLNLHETEITVTVFYILTRRRNELIP